jgi:hypothetical protein
VEEAAFTTPPPLVLLLLQLLLILILILSTARHTVIDDNKDYKAVARSKAVANLDCLGTDIQTYTEFRMFDTFVFKLEKRAC